MGPEDNPAMETEVTEEDVAGIRVPHVLDIGTQRYTQVRVLDEPGPGGACHNYDVVVKGGISVFSFAGFQKGPVLEAGVNGIFMEDLLAICIHRLRGFETGDFPCRENQRALQNIEHALYWLNDRTKKRQAQGVEGKSEAHES